jgi:hypothetical protein
VLLRLRVVDERDLERQVEEAPVDELIAIRQEHAEAGVRVVPAHDALALVARVHLLVDVLPGRVGERQLRALLLGVQRVDRGLDPQVRTVVVAQELAHEHAADLARGVALAARDDAIERVLRQEHAVLLARHRARLLTQVGLVDRAHVE